MVFLSFIFITCGGSGHLSLPNPDRLDAPVRVSLLPDPPLDERGLEYNIVPVVEVKASGALPLHHHPLPPAMTSPPQPPTIKIL